VIPPRGLSRSRRAAAAGKNERRRRRFFRTGAPPPPPPRFYRRAADPFAFYRIFNRKNIAKVGQFSTVILFLTLSSFSTDVAYWTVDLAFIWTSVTWKRRYSDCLPWCHTTKLLRVTPQNAKDDAKKGKRNMIESIWRRMLAAWRLSWRKRSCTFPRLMLTIAIVNCHLNPANYQFSTH